MLFNSLEFFVFFPIVTLLYFLLPHHWRWLMLLVASCLFYMAFVPTYILILFLTIIVDYLAGIYLERSTGKKKKTILIVSLCVTGLILFVFKYFNFFNANINLVAKALNWNYPLKMLEIILPIGLSFHTFQSMSYVIEVYRGNQKPEHHFGIYALYVMFYPQLVAGPIERPQNLLHQFREPHYFQYKRVSDGLKLMAWGLFKKVVIADRLAVFVNQVYNNPTQFTGIPLILATFFFAFQIYCDFSGYSDIAIGSAQVMGFKLMDNFNRPYYSKSIGEFWKRWHISLSTWFRDYVYIPLGGNKLSVPRTYFNLFLTFLLSGLWHGANWTYVVWGVLNGVYLIMELQTRDVARRFNQQIGLTESSPILKIVRVLRTFLLICFSWIFFRARSLSEAIYIVRHLFDGAFGALAHFANYIWLVNFNRRALVGNETRPSLFLDQSPGEIGFSLGIIGCLLFIHFIQRHGSIRHMLSNKSIYFRWTIYYAMVMGLFLFGFGASAQFIYFQF